MLSLLSRRTLLVGRFIMATSWALQIHAQRIKVGGTKVEGENELMSQKEHGTTKWPVQWNLRWDVSRDTADRICSFNRHYAERHGYWKSTKFFNEVTQGDSEMTFYDSVSGQPLFIAPRGRTMRDFLSETNSHGWPSFRDEEVVWGNVRILKDGEAVSTVGTHLGHNLPDNEGNRYCINLVSVAGNPVDDDEDGGDMREL